MSYFLPIHRLETIFSSGLGHPVVSYFHRFVSGGPRMCACGRDTWGSSESSTPSGTRRDGGTQAWILHSCTSLSSFSLLTSLIHVARGCRLSLIWCLDDTHACTRTHTHTQTEKRQSGTSTWISSDRYTADSSTDSRHFFSFFLPFFFCTIQWTHVATQE